MVILMWTRFVIKIHCSTLGHCFLLIECVISQGSKKMIVLSSMEYEYMALAKPIAKVIWFQQILYELGFPQSTPTFIYLDKKGIQHEIQF